MKQLTGVDASFLYMETPTTFGHVNGLAVYQRPQGRGFKPYDLFRQRIASRLGQIEPLRRRLVEVPLSLDHPWWIEDPDFDLDFHLRHIAVPPPGGDRELADLVARIIARPLDRTRPLWEAYVIEGLKGRRWAVLTKLHHATIDGASGAELLTMLLDPEPSPSSPTASSPTASSPAAPVDPTPADPNPEPERVPSPAEMLGRTALNLALRPERLARAQWRAWRDYGSILAGQLTPISGQTLSSALANGRPPALRGTPPTPFNRSIGSHRRLAFASASLDQVKRVKNHFGVTVNDVVMAACAGGLRRYLDDHDMLTDQPLVAGVPVSLRTGDEPDRWTNRVSMAVATVPTHLDDREERLAAAAEAMAEAKTTFSLVPADALLELADFSPPAVLTEASALATRLRVADQLPGPINLVISNVPGSRQPLYLGPAELLQYIPVSTIVEGQGLNITVQSYQDHLDFGLVGCRDLMPDIWDLLGYITDELDAYTALVVDG